MAKVILYVTDKTLPITASTENSGKEPKRIHGFTKSRILQKTNLKSNLDIYTYLYLGEILAICGNAMSSFFTFYNIKSNYRLYLFSCVITREINSLCIYSHLSNSRGGWNKQGGGAKVVKSTNVEEGIIEEVGIYLKNQ